MSITGIILEFLVIGTVACLSVLLFLFGIGVSVPENLSAVSTGQAITYVPLVYFFGMTTHYVAWALWKKTFHRRWLRVWVEDARRADLLRLAETAFLRSPAATSLSDYTSRDPYRKAALVLDWARFQVFEHASAESRSQYLRQFHLYRIAYGPAPALVAASVGLLWGGITSGPGDRALFLSLAVAILSIAISNAYASRHRVTRMWKYLCHTVAVIEERP